MSLKLRELGYARSNLAWDLFNRCNRPTCEYFGGNGTIPLAVVHIATLSGVFEALECSLLGPDTWL